MADFERELDGLLGPNGQCTTAAVKHGDSRASLLRSQRTYPRGLKRAVLQPSSATSLFFLGDNGVGFMLPTRL